MANLLSSKERRASDIFLSFEVPKTIEINYPTKKVQDIFKLNGRNNTWGKKKQEKRQKEKQ